MSAEGGLRNAEGTTASGAAAEDGDVEIAAVAVNTPLDRTFDYWIPEAMVPQAVPGARVRVEFGRRRLIGVCVARRRGRPERPLKPLLAALDEHPSLTPALLALGVFLADYYAVSQGEALTALLSGELSSGRRARREWVLHPGRPPEAMAAWLADARADARKKAQVRLVEAVLHLDGPYSATQLLRQVGCSPGPLRALTAAGVLAREAREVEDAPLELPSAHGGALRPALTEEQTHAAAAIDRALDAGGFAALLIEGVTGSGKTELYMRALERVLEAGKAAIVLVPEIALTPQTERVFARRFGAVTLLHSKLTEAERRRAKRALRRGEARLVLGPRSALFAPLEAVGLIVVDEEHDASYKQASTPRYHARDLAVMRAKIEGCPVLLGSATPSLESAHNARAGRYQRVVLRHRVHHRPLASVEHVDLKLEFAERGGTTWLSRLLEHALDACLRRGEQALLFLNRRGSSSQLHCPRCGAVRSCERCDIALTYHRRLGRLVCHYCFSNQPPPAACPACGGAPLSYLGVGTEKLETLLARRFPQARLARMDSDTMVHRDDYTRTFNAFAAGAVDVLVGTQMIVKGLDVPKVTLVGIINADASLAHPDFRATERTFQLLTQVAGRAGRGERPGLVVVQTFQPQHPVMQLAAAQNYEAFAQRELAARARSGYPPFGHLLRVECAARKSTAAQGFLDELAGLLRARLGEQAQVLGPAPAPIAKLRDQYRWHALVKAPRRAAIRSAVAALKPFREKRPHGVTLLCDVDPIHVS